MSNDTKPEEPAVEKAKAQPPATGEAGRRRARRTRGLRTMQKMENRLSKASRTLAEAFEEGFNTYRDERKKSAEKKRDGALVDFVNNFGTGFEEAQKVAAPASRDIITAFSTKQTRRQLRRAARAVSSFVPFLR